MRKGIFWCKDHNTDSPALIVVSALCDRNGKVSIFLNSDLYREPVLGMVFEAFELQTDEQLPVRIKSDGSQHCQYGQGSPRS